MTGPDREWTGASLSNVVSAYWGHPDEGIDSTSFHDWALEQPDDARAVSWLARYLAPSPAPNPTETGE